jgi:peptidoglycan/xylan/chitin deacetylase (PgdA/CDA1 family)
MGGRQGTGTARRWFAVITTMVASGWLSALAPGVASGAATPPRPPVARARTAPISAAAARPPVQEAPRRADVDCASRKCVALTFDDGPLTPTNKLLGILAAYRVKVTFFVVGQNVARYPEVVRRERVEGHELANHSYTHADLADSTPASVESELTRTQDAIRRAAGVTPVLMRPPYGSTDADVAAVTKRLKLAQILWAVDPLDWKDRDSTIVERRVVNEVRPGYIVLMHDIHPTTVDAVPNIIRRLAAKGYTFVTVSELFGRPLTPGQKYTKR